MIDFEKRLRELERTPVPPGLDARMQAMFLLTATARRRRRRSIPLGWALAACTTAALLGLLSGIALQKPAAPATTPTVYVIETTSGLRRALDRTADAPSHPVWSLPVVTTSHLKR